MEAGGGSRKEKLNFMFTLQVGEKDNSSFLFFLLSHPWPFLVFETAPRGSLEIPELLAAIGKIHFKFLPAPSSNVHSPALSSSEGPRGVGQSSPSGDYST